jgi:hypothetical protein
MDARIPLQRGHRIQVAEPQERVGAASGKGRRQRTNSGRQDPVDADTAGMQTLLDNSLVAWLGRLKTEAERH